MKLTHVSVSNYKGLRNTESSLSDFVCTIGENNAGKSSLLQALLLFINGTKLAKTEFYNPDQDIVIKVKIDHVTDEVLAKLTEEHRVKIIPYVKDASIVLARRYAQDGTSKLRVVTAVPQNIKYEADRIDDAFTGKKGKELGDTLLAFYPETTDAAAAKSVTTQKAAKEIIQNYVAQLPADQLVLKDIPLVTGIDNSIRSILPEPVYIAAVKDFSDELKTKESASFGKLLNILLDVIEGDLTEAAETFENLRKKLNRITDKDGNVLDERMDRVKAIEKTIQSNLQETFKNVMIELEIPPPEIKTVLSNANIVADDGVRGSVDNKGDGFKRAITFSILRSYVQLSQDVTWRKDTQDGKPAREKFLFLFEEPELYLHPRAQNILFDALALISQKHQVVVTTHSPLFFSADDTKTFIKVVKKQPEDAVKPIGECCPVDLTTVSEKDKFQLISFESSNFAFFSKKIVLVEGDSELIVLPHIASLLNPGWNFRTTSTSLVKISGKGSFKRYRDFFTCFNVDIAMVADLDILIKDFDKTLPSPHVKELLDDLLKDVDKIIDDENKLEKPSPRLLREELQRERARVLYEQLGTARSQGDIAKQGDLLDQLFIAERSNPRLEVLLDSTRAAIVVKKRALLSELRDSGVFVLEKGAIEAYYPPEAVGADKPSKAQSFCSAVKTAEVVRGLCELIPEPDGTSVYELEAVLKRIFVGG
jgi:putative ATP-dependent endonuclease of the OLD family